MYKLFLTLRYLRKRRIAIFAVISVWLCVAMVIIVGSVMGGFLDTLKERSRGLLSDIVVDNATLQGFPFYQEFIEHLHRKLPDVVDTATPVIYNYGILRIEATSFTKPVRVVGVRLDEYKRVNDFGNSLFYDKYYPGTTSLDEQWKPYAGFDEHDTAILPPDHEQALQRFAERNPDDEKLRDWKRLPNRPFEGPGNFDVNFDGIPGYFGEERDKAPGIIVGCNIINERAPGTGEYRRSQPRGSKLIVTILPLTITGKVGIEGATTVVTRLADDSRTRVFEIDDVCCYVDFKRLQEWLLMSPQPLEDGGETPARASQLLISLKPGVDTIEGRKLVDAEWEAFRASVADRVSRLDHRLMSFVEVETWEERQVQFIAAVEKERILVTALFGVISMVAVVLIGCIFWMIVVQKTRDIGIIKSIGASARGVAMIFVGFGVAVGVLGAALGAATGSLFVWYINDIQDFLVSLDPNLRVWSPDVYTFDSIPNVVKVDEVLVICLIAVVASAIGALIPATIAGRVWPVKALRYE